MEVKNYLPEISEVNQAIKRKSWNKHVSGYSNDKRIYDPYTLSEIMSQTCISAKREVNTEEKFMRKK